MTNAYRRNITKSRAGHYRLTLTSTQVKIRVTDKLGWSTPQQAHVMAEERLAAELAAYVERAIASKAA
jgi:hypothetical protein